MAAAARPLVPADDHALPSIREVAVPPAPFDRARAKIARGEGLTREEVAIVRSSLSAAELAQTEQTLGVTLEDLLVDADVSWERERAFLSGETAVDPWPASS